MSVKRFLLVITFCGASAGLALAQTALDRSEFRAEAKALGAGLTGAPASAPSAPGGADTDSFGRSVIFDGLLQSGTVSLQSDCTPVPGDPAPGPNDRCVTLNAAPATTTFDLPDIGQLTIPGRSAHSVLCHWLTPIAFYNFLNATASGQLATYRLIPYVVVESPVLADPSLIDPNTGLPFNGKLETSFAATYQDSQSLAPGQSAAHRFSESRVCIGGFLSKQALVQGYGLTDAQATAFFRQDITLHFGLRGTAASVGSSLVTYGRRVVGD